MPRTHLPMIRTLVAGAAVGVLALAAGATSAVATTGTSTAGLLVRASAAGSTGSAGSSGAAGSATLTTPAQSARSADAAAAASTRSIVNPPASGASAPGAYSPQAPSASQVAPNAGVLRVWAPTYMATSGTPYTLAQAQTIAKDYDMIAAKPKQFAGLVPAMKAVNPHLEIVAYMDGTMSTSSTEFASSWYLHDSSGNLVRTANWSTYAMNPANPAWIANRVSTCKSEIAASGYDGCFLDSLGRSVVDGSGYVDAIPVNPATGAKYTIDQYLAQTGALASAVRSAVAPKVIFGNNLGNGENYLYTGGPTSQLTSHLDVSQVEGFVRTGRAPLNQFNTVKVWLMNVTMLQDAGQAGTPLVVVTKSWNTGTQAQKDALHEFALGTFLLGATGSQRFSFLYDQNADPAAYSTWWNAPLGNPTGNYTALSNGTYTRSFGSGFVAVNPQATSETITLGTSWTDVSGGTVGPGTISMPAHTGLVLYH